MTAPELPSKQAVSLDSLQPYWRNPRDIGQDAIDAVQGSLEEYGYQQPIVVDSDNVIIVGHTRYYAMRQMGETEADVYVSQLSEEDAREYRLVDNRTQEYSAWDGSKLVAELREFEQSTIDRYFPNTKLELETLEDTAKTEDDVAKAESQLQEAVQKQRATPMTTVECPSCNHEFQMRTSSLPGVSAADLEELTLAAQQEG